MKIITIDLDGTLLSNNGDITKANIDAIHEAQNKGNIVAISSGRSLQDTQQILKNAGINCPIITGNGAKSFHNNTELHNLFLPVPIVKKMMSLLESSELYYEMYTKNGILIKNDGDSVLSKEIEKLQGNTDESFEWAKEIVKIQYKQHGLIYTDNYWDVDLTGLEVYKLFILSFNEEKLQALRGLISKRDDISVTSSGKQKLEIGHVEANKGNALKWLAEYYNVPLEYTVAIGDNLNDIPMFNIAGTSIAMGNAEPETKNYSTHITKRYDEDGVAYALKKYVI